MDVLKIEKMPEMLKNFDSCPICGSERFYSIGNEVFCNNCSLSIVEED